MNYYYLVASLPALRMDASPPMTSEEFYALCVHNLSRSDLVVFEEALSLCPSSSARLVARLRAEDRSLRNAIVRVRASNLHLDSAEHLHGDSLETAAERAVAEAYSRANPLEREFVLDSFRWRQFEEFAGFDPFALQALVVYGLRLRIVERWAAMDADAGTQRIEKLVSGESDNTTQETDAA